ncbi:GNAT family N-acetyltransferase [Leucobacter komagatae]|nr:GNAT family N-acetyltransferase [Leucobacter komagatae]
MATELGVRATGGGASARRMTRDDWVWIQRWFTDETLERELGPLDLDWLAHALTSPDGVQLVIEAPHPSSGKVAPIALVGVVWAGTDGAHAITDLAIDPARRGFGLGRVAIAATIAWPNHPPARSWFAFVDRENAAARAFFTAIGWTYEGLEGEGDEAMHRFATETST